MVTDSCSFLSYSRHEYFLRLLCDMIGRDIVSGKFVRDICFDNAKNYFSLAPGKV